MASKIGVYFDLQNIGGGLDAETLAGQAQAKWGDLTPVVKCVPALCDAEKEILADIEANGLDGVLLCGASPRDMADVFRLPVLTEHVNLREQCVLAYKNPDGWATATRPNCSKSWLTTTGTWAWSNCRKAKNPTPRPLRA